MRSFASTPWVSPSGAWKARRFYATTWWMHSRALPEWVSAQSDKTGCGTRHSARWYAAISTGWLSSAATPNATPFVVWLVVLWVGYIQALVGLSLLRWNRLQSNLHTLALFSYSPPSEFHFYYKQMTINSVHRTRLGPVRLKPSMTFTVLPATLPLNI
jgi:hypothetical protein